MIDRPQAVGIVGNGWDQDLDGIRGTTVEVISVDKSSSPCVTDLLPFHHD
jgi:hypothetical protein